MTDHSGEKFLEAVNDETKHRKHQKHKNTPEQQRHTRLIFLLLNCVREKHKSACCHFLLPRPWHESCDLDMNPVTLTRILWPWHESCDLDMNPVTLTWILWPWHESCDLDVNPVTLTWILWPWHKSCDLEFWKTPRYSEDVPLHNKQSCYVEAFKAWIKYKKHPQHSPWFVFLPSYINFWWLVLF